MVKTYYRNNMNSKRTYVATFWRGNPQLKNGGYYTTKEFQAVSHKAAERQTERSMQLLCAARRKHDTLCLNSKQSGAALLRRMHNLSRCKRIGFKRGAIPPAAQIQ